MVDRLEVPAGYAKVAETVVAGMCGVCGDSTAPFVLCACLLLRVGKRFRQEYRNVRPVVFSGLDLPAQRTWTDRVYLRGLSSHTTPLHRARVRVGFITTTPF
jgi:hypothetical protein